MGPKTTPAALSKVKVEETKIELVGGAGQRSFFGGGGLVSKSCPTHLRLHAW